MRRTAMAATALALAAVVTTGTARADSVSIGKAVPFAWTFLPADVGLEAGIWKKHGFDQVKIVGFAGDAKLQQGLLSKDIDFGFASGPGMAFNAKGGAGMGVAAYYRAPRNLSVAVKYDSKIAKTSELKGKSLGGTTAGSLTDWLTQRLSQHEGWGTTGITYAALGGLDTNLAALRTGRVDGLVLATEVAYDLEGKKVLRPIFNFADLVPKFITHVVFARKDLIASNPDKVKRFVAAFMETVAYMRANREKVIEISGKVLHMSPALGARVYDEEIKEFSTDGRFDPEAVAILAESYVGMGLLNRKPANDEIFTERFLP